MKPKNLILLLIGTVIGLSPGLYWKYEAETSPAAAAAAAAAAVETAEPDDQGPQVLYWYDPMYPGAHFDAPGKSPFMDMDLVPRLAEAGSGRGFAIDPGQVQNLGLKTTAVRRGRISFSRNVPADVAFNRYQEARVQSRAEGFVASAAKLAIGDKIEAGQVIAEITVPAWASDQSEYLLLKSQGAERRLIGGVREKLRLNGMPEEMLAEVDRTGAVQTNLSLRSPISGAITSLDVYPGMNVDKNMTLAVIQGFDPIWVTAEVPENDLSLALNGRARVTAAAWPGRVFEAEERSVLPMANKASRTVTLRLSVPNPEGLLKPGLTAYVRLRGSGPEGLIIPTQSVIDVGDEQRVVTRTPDGSFLPKLVSVAASAQGESVISAGLEEGDEVVVSSLFLIDSEANLSGALERMRREAQPSAEILENEARGAAAAAANENAQ
ncbi:MAG: efflux RND transporter periplasmic adaptor subunit [Deltaproteobacteria bacterium]|jgi:Cu(I)/Ag(I) efflux system membrane fusion protein|nr:efflux RND transporter periplasmic adaptor subunit [Deltaproteobacteria bacterium]